MDYNPAANPHPIINAMKRNREVIEDSNLDQCVSLVCVNDSTHNLYTMQKHQGVLPGQ